MQHLGTRLLRTQRLVLRRMTLDDCHDMYKNWACDPAVTRYLRWNAHRDWTVTAEFLHLVELQYQNPAFYQWGICLQDGTLVGSISVQPGERSAPDAWRRLPAAACSGPLWETGYALGRRWWGQGYAPEALAKVLHFWFEEVGARFWLPATPFLTRPAGGLLKSAVFTTTTMQYAIAMMAARLFAGPIVCWSPNGKNFLPPKRLNRSIYKFKKEYIHGRIHIGFWPRPFIRKRR